MIEHRHRPRIPVSLKAVLYHPHGYICPCAVDNISTDGVFIRSPDNRFQKGSIVEVAIEDSIHHKKNVKFKGLVIHDIRNGVGIMCIDTVLQAYLQKTRQNEDTVSPVFF